MDQVHASVVCGPSRVPALEAALRRRATPDGMLPRLEELGDDPPLCAHFRAVDPSAGAARDLLARFLGSPILRLAQPRSHSELRLRAASLGAIRFLMMENEADLVIESPGHPSAYILIIPLAGMAHHRAEQQVIHTRPGTALIRNPSCHIHLAGDTPLRTLFVRIDADVISSRLTRLLRRPLKEKLAFDYRLDLADQGRSLWNSMSWLCKELDNEESVLRKQPAVAQQAEIMLVDTLLSVQHSNHSDALAAAACVAVPRHLKIVLTAIDSAPEAAWSLSDMANAGDVSVRTLCDAFRHFRGCTPMEFVRSVRLARARDELRRNGQSVSISDIARRWGFGHPGRFAATYRRAYGQTPSETLRFGAGQEGD